MSDWVKKDVVFFRGPRAWACLTANVARRLNIFHALNSETFLGAKKAHRALAKKWPNKVPVGATVIALQYRVDCNQFRILLQHKSFGDTEYGLEYPACLVANSWDLD